MSLISFIFIVKSKFCIKNNFDYILNSKLFIKKSSKRIEPLIISIEICQNRLKKIRKENQHQRIFL